MVSTLTTGEIKAALAGSAKEASRVELSDPWQWVDLTTQPDATVRAVRRRLGDSRSPLHAQVFRWPKDRGGYRPMAWLDPLDQVVYRSAVGRLVQPIAASVDFQSVLSGRVASVPPRWGLEPWTRAITERRETANRLHERYPYMGVLDVKEFFPSVKRPVLEEVIGDLPVNRPSFDFVLDWLGDLEATSGIRGLPVGMEASRVLANGVLVPCDSALSELGVPFLRYVDDTWFFVDDERWFGRVRDLYEEQLGYLGLELNAEKTQCLEGLDARNEIERLAIAYMGDALEETGPTGLDAALELFEFALEAPVERRSELRKALGHLTGAHDPRPLRAVQEDPGLMALAPHHWVKYLGALADHRPTRMLVDDDWLVEGAAGTITKTDSYRNLLFLRVAARRQLKRDLGRQVFDIATNEGAWKAPVRVWAAYVWGRSEAFRPNVAVEQVGERGDLSTRRAFAMTLAARKADPKYGEWCRRVRRADPELEPTAAWLEAA